MGADHDYSWLTLGCTHFDVAVGSGNGTKLLPLLLGVALVAIAAAKNRLGHLCLFLSPLWAKPR